VPEYNMPGKANRRGLETSSPNTLAHSTGLTALNLPTVENNCRRHSILAGDSSFLHQISLQ